MLVKEVPDGIICKVWNANIAAFVVFRIGLQNQNRLRPKRLKTLYDVNRLYRGLLYMYNCKIVSLYGMINLSIVFFIPSYFIQPVSAKICYSYQRGNRMRSMYFIISKIAMRTITRYYGKKTHTWKWLINRCRPEVGVTKQLSSAPVFSQSLE